MQNDFCNFPTALGALAFVYRRVSCIRLSLLRDGRSGVVDDKIVDTIKPKTPSPSDCSSNLSSEPEPETSPESGGATKAAPTSCWNIISVVSVAVVARLLILSLLRSGMLDTSLFKATGQQRVIEVETANSPIRDSTFAPQVNTPFHQFNVPSSASQPSKLYNVKLDKQRMHMVTEDDEDYFKSAYYGTISVGTPAEEFRVVFDTGSGHLVLPSAYCRSEVCKAHKRYRRSRSSTAKDINYDGSLVQAGQNRDQLTVTFGTGEVTGVFVEDVVCLKDGIVMPDSKGSESSTAITLPSDSSAGEDDLPEGCVKMRMLAATEMSEDPFSSFQFDGILGLGLEGLSQTPEFNFLEVVSSPDESIEGVNMPQTFAVFLADDGDEESEITLGGWSWKHLREDLSWVPVDDPELGHWALKVKGVRIDNEPLPYCQSGCKAVVDTGTALLSVPSDIFPTLYTDLKHEAPLAGDCWTSQGPKIHVEFEDFTLTIGPREYSQLERNQDEEPEPEFLESTESHKTRSDLWCKPVLMTLDLDEPLGPKLFILGEPILRKYYTVYDARNRRVGFGRAKHRRTSRTATDTKEEGATTEVSRLTPRRVTMFDAFRSRKLVPP